MFEKLTNAPGTNAFPWINLYPISNAIAYSYSLDSDFLLFNNRALSIVFRVALKPHKPYKFHYGTSAPPLNDPFR